MTHFGKNKSFCHKIDNISRICRPDLPPPLTAARGCVFQYIGSALTYPFHVVSTCSAVSNSGSVGRAAEGHITAEMLSGLKG